MADQQVPEGTEPEATPESGTPTVDWQKRYEDLRPQYDQLQNQHNNPEARRQLFDQLAQEYGYTIDEGEPENEPVEDPYADPYDTRLAQLERAEQQRQQEWQEYLAQQDQQRAIQYAETFSENKLDELNIENERQREWIVSRATMLSPLEVEGNIVPDIDAAYAEYKELVAAEQQAWAQTKNGAPHVPTGGAENTGVQPWSDDPQIRAQQRQEWMAQEAARRMAP